MTKYLSNAFSLQMVSDNEGTITYKVVDQPSDLSGYKSVVGHADTANVLGVECNRANLKLQKGDVLLVAQLVGGRLPEGATTLPEEFSFKFFEVEIK